MKIGAREIGAGHPCYIAEAGVNHNGSLDMAKQMVDVAADAGADAIKFQTFKADKAIAPGTRKADYQSRNTNDEDDQLEMVRRLELSHEEFTDLAHHCAAKGIEFLSTPFDDSSIDFLSDLGMVAYKVPSGEAINVPYLRRVAACGVPVLLSTGMCTMDEVRLSVKTLQGAGATDIAVMHCVSCYPAPPEDSNLKAMAAMGEVFGVPVGYSDHTLGVEVSLAAVALGAVVLEKHFTLDRAMDGPDHAASHEPSELKALMKGVRLVEASLGDGVKAPQPSETDTLKVVRRSLFIARPVAQGAVIAAADLMALRPASGISPAEFDRVVGKSAATDLEAGQMLTWDVIENTD